MEIRENLSKVQQEICQAAIAAGRDPKEITLIAVSKTKPIEMVAEAAAWGMLDFGENRPQELAEKAEMFPQLQWHQIGQLQKNKVKHIIAKACLIHSVDSLSLCQEIEKRAAAINKVQDILIQVNISGEATKSGIRPNEAAELCSEISKLPHVRVRGLMTISVLGMSEEENFALFTDLRRLAESLQGMGIPNVSMEELSMGMTHDFVPAIRAGATMVRVGTGIFGSRK